MADYNWGWGLRKDNTFKGPGFAADITDDGSYITEMSAGPKDALYPSVYQGILPWEILMLRDAPYTPYQNWSPELRAIDAWALYQGSLRKMVGQSPFWQPADGASGVNFEPWPRR